MLKIFNEFLHLEINLGRVLTDILLDEKFTKKMTAFLPKDHEWDLMSDLSTVLGDLSEVATYMCSEKKIIIVRSLPYCVWITIEKV
jgi:hypothetical protein